MTNHPEQAPIFKHRFDSSRAKEIDHINDSIGLITEGAKGILYMLHSHFSGEQDRYNNQIVQAAIDAAISEIEDIDSTLNAHWLEIKPQPK